MLMLFYMVTMHVSDSTDTKWLVMLAIAAFCSTGGSVV